MLPIIAGTLAGTLAGALSFSLTNGSLEDKCVRVQNEKEATIYALTFKEGRFKKIWYDCRTQENK